MIVGMDFGTTNSGMSTYDGQHLELIPLDPANANPRVARTALYITNQRRVYLGREAVEKYYAQNINREVKYQRVWVGEITLTFAELPEFVRDVTIEKDVLSPGRLFLSFKTSLRSASYLGTMVGSQFYFLEDIVGLYLYAMRRRAEDYLHTDLNRIVLGRPVRFSNDDQQNKLAEQRLVHAAFRAGYDEVYLQYEPIAAAHFYETQIDTPQNVLIFDFGGGTLDITIARLGDPAKREILATGGVPIAGDVFDQKLVRATLPRHFGESSHFESDTYQRLPVPANFYEAFSDWQEMLELNKPDMLQILERIQRTAEQPRQLRMLINLIKSSYGLKMFDAAEATKRDLSARIIALLTLNGSGFNASETVTRDAFELLIRQDVATIADALDETMRQAGLTNDQIDAVIRTGGSAQIPAFIHMLNERFGPEKVREIDTFSSVTSGLGIIGHYIERDEIDLPCYRRSEWTYGTSVRDQNHTSAPTVDLDLMKTFIDLGERDDSEHDQQIGIVAVNGDTQVEAATLYTTDLNDHDLSLNDLGLAITPGDHIITGTLNRAILLITTEYRFLLRTVQDLADLAEVNMSVAQMESFVADRFGRETLATVVDYEPLENAERVMLITTKGKAKLIQADMLLPHFKQTYPYQVQHMAGDPVAMVPADDHDILLLTNLGSVARIQPGALANGEQTIVRLRKNERVIGALSAQSAASIVVASAKGHGKRIHIAALERLNGTGTGTRVITGSELRGYGFYRASAPLWALTTQRLTPIANDAIPLDAPPSTAKHTLLRMKPGEELIALCTLG